METKYPQEKTLVTFDLDGTLIDSNMKLKRDVAQTLGRLGVNILPENVRGDWYKLAEKYRINKELFDKEFDKRKTWEQSLKDGDVTIYQDTVKTLRCLGERGIKLALLSKSIPEYTEQKINFFDIKKYFDTVETVHPIGGTKIDGATNIIRKLQPKKILRAFFVGDREEDVIISNEIENRFNISSQGIYINRDEEDFKLGRYPLVRSLEEILEMIRV